MSYDVIPVVLAADVANGGTFTANFPTGRTAGSYAGGYDHAVLSNKYGLMRNGVTVSFALTTLATITNNTGVTLEQGTQLYVQLDRPGATGMFQADDQPLANDGKMSEATLFRIDLGSPSTADADGAVASQAATAAGGLATGINGALAVNGVATFATPRNVVAAWTGAAVLTVTGTDEYGRAMRESSASGTSMTGKKAFKTITGISVSADVTGLTVGEGVVLGLPVFLPEAARIVREIMDGAPATAGTTVAGVRTAATATTGDVRGTYSPNSAPNGSRAYALMVALDNPADRGVAQFAG